MLGLRGRVKYAGFHGILWALPPHTVAVYNSAYYQGPSAYIMDVVQLLLSGGSIPKP